MAACQGVQLSWQSMCAGAAVRAGRGLRSARLQEAGGGALLGAQCQPTVCARGQAAGPVGRGKCSAPSLTSFLSLSTGPFSCLLPGVRLRWCLLLRNRPLIQL